MNYLPRRSRLPRWLLTLSLLGAVPFVAQASPYTVTFVPGVHDADRPALKLDVANAPHLVWHALEASPILLRYATFDGADWTVEDVDTLELGLTPPSLALQDGVTPVVVDTRSNWAQRVAERTAPGVWTIEALQGHGMGRWGALAIDPSGQRHVFHGNVMPSVAHSRRLGPDSWATEDVLPDQWTYDFRWNQLAADAALNLRACYVPVQVSGTNLRYTERVGGTWKFPEIASPADADAGASLAIGPDGLSTISLFKPAQGVGLLHRDGPSNWSFEGIDAAGTGPTSLAWDNQGRAHVAYVKAGAIWQAVRPIDGAWVKEMVTTPGVEESDAWPTLSLDSNGEAAIAFVRSSPREGGGTERALGIARDVKTLAADPDATTDKALAIEWIAPQPTRGAGRIALRLALATNVTLELVSVDGRRVASKAVGVLPAGPTTVAWDPGALAPGVYLLRVVSERGPVVTRRWVAL